MSELVPVYYLKEGSVHTVTRDASNRRQTVWSIREANMLFQEDLYTRSNVSNKAWQMSFKCGGDWHYCPDTLVPKEILLYELLER